MDPHINWVHILWGSISYMCLKMWTPHRKWTPGPESIGVHFENEHIDYISHRVWTPTQNGPQVHILWGSILYMCYRIWTPYRKWTSVCVDIIYSWCNLETEPYLWFQWSWNLSYFTSLVLREHCWKGPFKISKHELVLHEILTQFPPVYCTLLR